MSADDANKLFVGGVNEGVTEESLRRTFEQAGFSVMHLAVPRDRETGRVRGFAFVTLKTEAEAQAALAQLQGCQVDGQTLSVRPFAQDGPKRGPRPPREDEPTVFLGRLPFEATVSEITDWLLACGVSSVARVSLPMGPDGRPRGFGFATLGSQEDADLAVSKANGAMLKGRQIAVSPAQAKGRGAGQGGFGASPAGRGAAEPYDRGGDARPSSRPEAPESYRGGSAPSSFGDSPGPSSFVRDASVDQESRKRRVEVKKRPPADAAAERRKAPPQREKKPKRGGGNSWHQWESDDD